MANGTIKPGVVFPSSGSFKLPNGIIVAWGSTSVRTSQQSSSSIFPYRGYATVSVASFGISNIICAFANVYNGAGYWNASVSTFSGDSMGVTAGGDKDQTTGVAWLAIGT